MNKIISRILSAFILNRKKRHRFRESAKGRIKGGRGNEICLERPLSAQIHIRGKNNKIIFRESQDALPFQIDIYGDGNVVEIGANVIISGDCCKLCIAADNANFSIGENTQLNTVDFLITENESRITIGKDCIFSWGIKCWATDAHAILDTTSGQVTNYGKFIEIGDHVWVGMDVKIGKNVKIEDGCIIGWGSTVTKSVLEKNSIAAGVPAIIVKRNRTWVSPTPDKYKPESTANDAYTENV